MELLLTPAAAGFRRRLQRIDELACLGAGVGLHAGEALDLSGEPAIGRDTGFFDFRDAFAVFLQACIYRRKQRLDGSLTLVKADLRAFFVASKCLVRPRWE